MRSPPWVADVWGTGALLVAWLERVNELGWSERKGVGEIWWEVGTVVDASSIAVQSTERRGHNV